MFPVSVGGAVKLRKRDNPALLVPQVAGRLEDLLEQANATDWSVEGREVRFTVALWRAGWNWNILAPFESGRFEIEPRDDSVVVRYRLSTRRILGVVSAAMAGLALFMWHGQGNVLDVLGRYWPTLAGGWAWLFGTNYLMATIRVPFWLKRGLRTVR